MFNPKPVFGSKLLVKAVMLVCRPWLNLNRVKLHNWETIDTIMHQRVFDINLLEKGLLDIDELRQYHRHLQQQNNSINDIDTNKINYNHLTKTCSLRPIITVSNHVANLDDPIMWGNLDWEITKKPQYMRWTLGASNILFTNALFSFFFTLGKCVKTIRGNGIYQEAIDFSIDRLSEFQWMHIFPEGRVNQNKELLYFKWGVGRMVAESEFSPLILPIYHRGLEQSMPLGKPAIPRFGKDLEFFVGEPFECDDLIRDFKADLEIDVTNKETTGSQANIDNDLRKKKYYKLITTRIEEKFKQLRESSIATTINN